MANEIYTDPSAKAEVLGMGNSPENQQIAANIWNKGLGPTLNTLNTGGGEGSGIPMGMPPTPQMVQHLLEQRDCLVQKRVLNR